MGFFRAFRPIALDLLASIVFVLTLWATNNVVLATVVGIASGVARFVWMKLRGLPVGPLQYVSVLLVIGSGAATIYTNDVHFMQIKSSLVAAAVAVVMLTTNWMAPYLPPIVTENLEPRIVRWASLGWGALILGLAVANAVVALRYSIAVWTAYTAVVPAAVQIAGFAVQFLAFRHLIGRNIRAKAAVQPVANSA